MMQRVLFLPLLALILLQISSISATVFDPKAFPDYVANLPNYTSGAFPLVYSGFAPLDDQNNSAIFYWYIPSQYHPSNEAPTLLWLNGGPGASGVGSIFTESGPFRLKANGDGGFSVYNIDEPGNLQSWTAFYNVLYLDQPVGTGYSYTANNSYRENEDDIGNDVWKAVQYFLKVHPETASTKWYFSGESYAGRFVPASTYWTLLHNDEIKAGKLQGTVVNLQGMLVASGFVLAVSQRISSIEASHTANLLTPTQYKQIKTIAAECQQLSGMGSDYTIQADNRCDAIMDYYTAVAEIDAGSMTLNAKIPIGFFTDNYFNHPDVVQALNAQGSKKQGVLFNGTSSVAAQHLMGDRLNNSLVYINAVLQRIPCLFFAGNMDARDGAFGHYEWFKYLDGNYPSILQTTRNIWYVNQISVGMYTQYQNLTYISINSAGHQIPFFALNTTVKMIEIFTQRQNNWNYYSGLTPTPVPKMMCQYANNCNGNGQCLPAGTCACNVGYGLADCSVKAVNLDTSKTYTINQRGFLFFSVKLNGKDQMIEFDNKEGDLGIFYTPFAVGPVADAEDAEASLLPSPNTGGSRSLHLNSYGRSVGYLTIQNLNYFNSTTLTMKLLPSESSTKGVKGEHLGLQNQQISWVLYALSAIMCVASVLVIVDYKRKSQKRSEEIEGQDVVNQPLIN